MSHGRNILIIQFRETMKFVSEMEPQILGLIITFLLLFCTFSSCDYHSDDHHDDYASYEDVLSSETTTSTTTTTTTTTTPRSVITNARGSGKTAPDPHVIALSIDSSFDRKIKCRGAAVTNLTFIECDRSIVGCRKKLSCLMNGTMCTGHDVITSGEDCFDGLFYHSHSHDGNSTSGPGTEKCLSIKTSWGTAGIIKCVSSLPLASSSSSPTQKSTTTTKIDYLYTGVDYKAQLLSGLVPPFQHLIKLDLDYSTTSEDEEIDPLIIYTGEEILLHCVASSFFFSMKSIKIEARTENGTELKIDPALVFTISGTRGREFQRKFIQTFRMAKDISTLSCSGRRLDNSETVQTTWNITVIDPPLQLVAKSQNGTDFQVVSKIGCNLDPSQTTEESKTVRKKLLGLLDISRHSHVWIKSVIHFVRFQDITDGHYLCRALQSQGNSNSNASSADTFDYYFDPEVKRATIAKPDSASSVILKGHSHLSLKCKYTGNPMPYVIWLHNGKEIFYSLQTKSSEGEGDFEEAVLHLPVKNLDSATGISSDSNSKSGSGSNSNEEYSCVVRNHLGADQLDFIIENDKDSPGFSGSASGSESKSNSDSGGLIYVVIISSLLVVIFTGLFYFIFTRRKHRTKRSIVTKYRVAESVELDKNGGETFRSHSNNHTDSKNDEFSRGVTTTSTFQCGDGKYKILT